jgi:hypothetical protein
MKITDLTAMLNSQGQATDAQAGRYTHRTVALGSRDGAPTTRSVDKVRTHAQLAADKIRDPALGEGVSMRMAMSNQCVNDQFPYTTDEHGKQR